ncbi:MAG: HK97 gp10 family phage protein [Patescibacteria group bacterium]|nr:HK97 gp10 family phage protein [Patescibacteria group bacterium]
MSEEIEIQGLSELYAELETLGPRIARNIIRGGVYAMAKDVAEKIRDAAPVLQPQTLNPHDRPAGQLKAEIKAVRKRWQYGNVEAGVLIGSKAFYWRFLEYGTVRLGARPFARPTWDAVKYVIVDKLAAYARARFDRAVKS